MNEPEPTALMMEIGEKVFPRRYRRFKDLRSYQEACEWAKTLDWQRNPYDRFLLRRELLHYLESTQVHKGRWNVYGFASRDEITAAVDRLLNHFPDESKPMGIFAYVTLVLPWHLGFRYGLVQHSRLDEALAGL